MRKTKGIIRNRQKMKGKRAIAGILLAGILAVTLTGCKNTDDSKKETTEVSLSDVLHDLKTIISGQIHAKQLELYMDANAFDEDRKKAMKCGMDGFLSKPIVIEELIGALQKNLDPVSGVSGKPHK